MLPFSSTKAHDAYTTLHSATGQLCCGGDPITGDCEGIDEFDRLPNGDARFYSPRYKAWILISSIKIVELPIPEEGVIKHEAHFCGVPRARVQAAPINAENPDLAYWTYCAFIAPGGV